MPSRVTVTLTDGRVLTRALSDYPGFWTRPQTWDEAVAKYTKLASPHVSAPVLGEIETAIHNIEHIKVAELMRLLRNLGTPKRNGELEAA
jgi:2-methylcitrate dehydratase